MTMNFPLSQSPRTQSFQAPVPEEDENELFSQSFSELAYKAYQKTLPELLSNVITLRLLDASAEEGRGVGTFILRFNQDVIFVPVVVSDNSIKPLEVFYSRTTDKFYPLTINWLNEATKDNVDELGRGVDPPKDLATDVDIRNLVVPPTTGRYSYASADDIGWAPFEAAARKEASAKEPSELQFLNVLREAPKNVKEGYAKFLKANVKTAQLYAEVYGGKNLVDAIKHETVKEADTHRLEVDKKPEVYIASNTTPAAELKAKLGPKEGAGAFKQTRLQGFYVKDERPDTADLLSYAQTDLNLTTPEEAGIYRIWFSDGTSAKVLIVPNAFSIDEKPSDERRMEGYHRPLEGQYPIPNPRKKYLVLVPDGRYGLVTELIAEPVITESRQDIQDFIEKMTSKRPSASQMGVLVAAVGKFVRATEPFDSGTVTDRSGLTTCDKRVIINDRIGSDSIIQPQDAATVMFGNGFRWFKCDKYMPAGEVIKSSKMIERMIETDLQEKGARKVEVKKAGDRFFVGGDRIPLVAHKAVEKIANLYDLSVPDASDALTAAAVALPVTIWSVKKGAESLDPNAPPVPEGAPQPSGLDLAVSERIEQINAQMAALQQMQQILLETQQRAQSIDQGGGAMAAPSAAAGMAAGPAQPPSSQGGPQMAAVPGMGGQPPSPPISQEPPPPPPVMPAGEQSPESIAQQVNPDFVEQASDLNSKGIFDAVAIASLAKTKDISDTLQNHIPALENAMDALGRVLLLLFMKEQEIQEQIGKESYEETEQKVRDVLKGLGASLLAIKKYGQFLSSHRQDMR